MVSFIFARHYCVLMTVPIAKVFPVSGCYLHRKNEVPAIFQDVSGDRLKTTSSRNGLESELDSSLFRNTI